jgi:RNA polymerase sigma factor (sigma-70 family)
VDRPPHTLEDLVRLQRFEEAFHKLVDEESEFLMKNISRWVKDKQFAQDVLQNTFIRIWKGLPDFKAESKLTSWSYRIAFNESMNFLRRENKLSVVDGEDHWFEPGSTEIETSGEDINKKLQSALEQLPDRQRQVFELRYYNELDYQTIAEKLGLSIGSLKASFHHARIKIESILRASD